MPDFWKNLNNTFALTEDDRGAVRELLASPGWRVLTLKVYPKQELLQLSQVTIVGEDNPEGRRQTGVHEGLRLSQTLAEKAGREPEQQPQTQQSQERHRKIQLQRKFARGSKPL